MNGTKLESAAGTAGTVTVAGVATGALISTGLDPMLSAGIVAVVAGLIGAIAQAARESIDGEQGGVSEGGGFWRRLLAALG